MANFVHLHVHTQYSLLDGLSKIPELIKRAKDFEMDSLAITDHGALYGAIHFYLKAKEAGIKPIIGVEAYMAHRSRFDKQPKIDADQYHLVLLAKNDEGYKNLMRLVTKANLEGFYYKPRIDIEVLKEFHKGLIALTACIEGEIPSLIREGKNEEAQKKALEFQGIFGDDLYLEIQKHKINEQDVANKGLISLSRKLGIPLVATNDVHYVNPDDAEAQDALLAIQTQKKIEDKDRLTMLDSPDFYLRSPEEMSGLFEEFPDAIENTLKIADECNLEISIGTWILPVYPLPEDETSETYLRKKVYEYLPKRFPTLTEEIKQRIEYELEIIIKKKFPTYFLIVSDIVNWAKQEGIRVGPGRGSVAGSLVAYVLRITSINPLEHNLPFERFLNPFRPTPPDIDLDFADNRRDEVLDYVREKYGNDKVAQIITFGSIEARMAVRDITRVLGFPYSLGDRIAKMIPLGSQGSEMTVEKALDISPELAVAYEKEPEVKKILNLAKKIEGVSRQASTHAAGVVIADKELTDYTPLQFDTKKEVLITQYDMYALDLNVSDKAIGLLKMDFLGLRNLTILEKAKEYILKSKGVDIDISELPLDDRKVYEMISKGETGGIFQLESAGMKRLARQLKPSRFSDLSAMIALFRPGPMQFIPEFIAGKEIASKIKYPHPDLKLILEETYGIVVYQEQCLQIANLMAGYSLGEADNLRRAIGKKKKEIMEKEKIKFIEGSVKKGYKKEIAEQVFGLIERFAGYGFNKAHSTSYALIAYQTAWMKANYPVEFMTALLTAESEDTDKIAFEIEECRRMGITVLPPDVNKSFSGFTIEKDEKSLNKQAIRFGLSAIKNVGEAATEEILDKREKGGLFKGLSDFCSRTDSQKINKKVCESLIKSGALDQFGKRAAMLSGLDKIRQKSDEEQKRKAGGQTSLFEKDQDDPKINFDDNLPQIDEFSKNELASLEKELLGFCLTEHPLSSLMSVISSEVSHKISQLDIEESTSNQRVKIGGLISGLRIVITKSGSQEMAFVSLEDDTGRVEVVVFPKIFNQNKEIWIKGQVVMIEGRVESREEGISIIAEKAFSVTQEDTNSSFNFVVKIPKNTPSKKLMELNNFLKSSPGDMKGLLIFENANGLPKKLALNFGVDFNKDLEEKINTLLKVD